jgi:hypothetical protein
MSPLVSLASNYTTMRAVAFKRKDQQRGRWIGKQAIAFKRKDQQCGRWIGKQAIAFKREDQQRKQMDREALYRQFLEWLKNQPGQ